MKGVVFNLLEAFVVENWGEQTWEDLLDLCPLRTKEPFVGPGTYPDEDLVALAVKASEILGVPLPDALRAFGRFAFPKLGAAFPTFLEPYDNAATFLRSVESVIHVEVRKLMPEAVTPRFEYAEVGPDQLRITYRSRRQLCFFMEGLLQGVADHFGTTIAFSQSRCMHAGADACDFDIRFAGMAQSAA